MYIRDFANCTSLAVKQNGIKFEFSLIWSNKDSSYVLWAVTFELEFVPTYVVVSC